MADFISGIKNIVPSYPVKPVQPVPKDRGTGHRKNKPRKEPEHSEDRKREDGDHGSTIDEHV